MEDTVNSTNTENHKCMDCGRILKSQSGLKKPPTILQKEINPSSK